MNRILELLQGPDPDDAAFRAWWDATFTGAPCHGDMTAHAVAYAAWLGRGGDVARRLRERAKELRECVLRMLANGNDSDDITSTDAAGRTCDTLAAELESGSL